MAIVNFIRLQIIRLGFQVVLGRILFPMFVFNFYKTTFFCKNESILFLEIKKTFSAFEQNHIFYKFNKKLMSQVTTPNEKHSASLSLNFQSADQQRTSSFVLPWDQQKIKNQTSPKNNLTIPKLKFVNESDFKKEGSCFVCKIPFGNLKDRQHHCRKRMCGHSACNICSSKQVNDKRACDICFFKASQLTNEKRRSRFLKEMKEHIQKMERHIIAGQQKLANLDRDMQDQEKTLNEEKQILLKEQENLESQLIQQQLEKQKLESLIQQLDEQIQPKRVEKEKLVLEELELDTQLRQIETDITLKQQTFLEKQEQLEKLQKNLMDLEQSDSFLNLSHYNEAVKQAPKNISEQIIALNSSKQIINESSGVGTIDLRYSLGNNHRKQSEDSISIKSKNNAANLYNATFVDQQIIKEMMNSDNEKDDKANSDKRHQVRNKVEQKKGKDKEKELSGCGTKEACRLF